MAGPRRRAAERARGTPSRQENSESNDDEVHDGLETSTVVEGGRPRRLGRGDGRIVLPGEIDEEIRELSLAQEQADRGHQNVADERRHDLAKGRADDHANG